MKHIKTLLKTIVLPIAIETIKTQVSQKVTHYLTAQRDKKFVNIFIPESNQFFDIISNWLSGLEEVKRGNNLSMQVNSSFDDSLNKRVTNLCLYPGEGTHHIKYKGKLLLISKVNGKNRKTVQDQAEVPAGSSDEITEKGYEIKTRKENREFIIQALRQAYIDSSGEFSERSSLYYTRWSSSFSRSKTAKIRPWESVILDKEVKDKLANNVESFLNDYEWYKERGIPYRKGFLLYGPPGTGKTSIIKGLAHKYQLDVYIISFSGHAFSEEALSDLLSQVPFGSILLFEDIDGLFSKRENANDISKISFRSFINLLDGVLSPNGVIYFMTTNKKDELDPALIRRAHVQLYVGPANKSQAIEYFKFFYRGNYTEEDLKTFSNTIVNIGKLSISTLQDYLMDWKDFPEEGCKVKNLRNFLNDTQRLSTN